MDRPTEEIERMRMCAERDACCVVDCAYYLKARDFQLILRYLEKLEENGKTNTYSDLEDRKL